MTTVRSLFSNTDKSGTLSCIAHHWIHCKFAFLQWEVQWLWHDGGRKRIWDALSLRLHAWQIRETSRVVSGQWSSSLFSTATSQIGWTLLQSGNQSGHFSSDCDLNKTGGQCHWFVDGMQGCTHQGLSIHTFTGDSEALACRLRLSRSTARQSSIAHAVAVLCLHWS